MAKHFFDENEKYSEAATTISQIARDSGIREAFKWALTNGYSIREASYIIHNEVTDEELSILVLDKKEY
jgi:hypothetical protein